MTDATRRIRLLKRLTLGIFLVSVAGVAGLYMLGRGARIDDPDASETVPDDLDAPPGQQSGEGFDHTLMRGDEPLFRIRGKRDRQTEEGRLIVEGVDVTIFREDGTEMRVWADEASYDLEAEEASLRGNVRVEGGEGFSLSTEALFVVSGGDAIQVDTQFEFSYGGESPLEGRAEWFRANLLRDVFILRGDVDIRNQAGAEPPFRVRAPRVFLERNENMLRALDGVRVEWSGSVVTARKVTAHLGRRNREIHFLRALQNVQGTLDPGEDSSSEGGFRRITIEGSRLGILFGDDGPSKVELEDLNDGRSEILATRPGGEIVELVAGFIQGDLAAGALTAIQAVDDVVLTQTLPQAAGEGGAPGAATEPTIRTASGARAEATFASSGELRMVELEGGVRIVEGPRTLDGQRARILPDRLEAHGEPALLVSPDGELEAPSVSYDLDSRLTHATGGVRALLERGGDVDATTPLEGTPLGTSGEPVRVEAEEAFFRQDPRAFLFKGAVRAWSGDQVILTEQLRGDAEPQRLSAAEGVETQWIFEPETGATQSGADESGAEPRPIRINARTMIYDPEKRELEYRDRVTVVEPGRRLTCRLLTAELGEDGEVRHLTCLDRVVLESEVEGRRVQADRAEYDLDTRRVRFFGEPLQMTDREGLEIQCLELAYSLDADTVQCLGSPRPDGE